MSRGSSFGRIPEVPRDDSLLRAYRSTLVWRVRGGKRHLIRPPPGADVVTVPSTGLRQVPLFPAAAGRRPFRWSARRRSSGGPRPFRLVAHVVAPRGVPTGACVFYRIGVHQAQGAGEHAGAARRLPARLRYPASRTSGTRSTLWDDPEGGEAQAALDRPDRRRAPIGGVTVHSPPISPRAATASELKSHIEAEREGLPFLVFRDADATHTIFALDEATRARGARPQRIHRPSVALGRGGVQSACGAVANRGGLGARRRRPVAQRFVRERRDRSWPAPASRRRHAQSGNDPAPVPGSERGGCAHDCARGCARSTR